MSRAYGISKQGARAAFAALAVYGGIAGAQVPEASEAVVIPTGPGFLKLQDIKPVTSMPPDGEFAAPVKAAAPSRADLGLADDEELVVPEVPALRRLADDYLRTARYVVAMVSPPYNQGQVSDPRILAFPGGYDPQWTLLRPADWARYDTARVIGRRPGGDPTGEDEPLPAYDFVSRMLTRAEITARNPQAVNGLIGERQRFAPGRTMNADACAELTYAGRTAMIVISGLALADSFGGAALIPPEWKSWHVSKAGIAVRSLDQTCYGTLHDKAGVLKVTPRIQQYAKPYDQALQTGFSALAELSGRLVPGAATPDQCGKAGVFARLLDQYQAERSAESQTTGVSGTDEKQIFVTRYQAACARP